MAVLFYSLFDDVVSSLDCSQVLQWMINWTGFGITI